MKHIMIVVMSLLLIVSFAAAESISIAVAPPSIDFGNTLAGFAVEKQFVIINEGETAVIYNIAAQDNAAWYSFSPSRATIEPQTMVTVVVRATPPEGTALGSYNTIILVKPADNQTVPGSQSAIGIIPAFEIPTTLSVVEGTIDWEIIAASATSVEQGQDVIFTIEVRNTGTLDITPIFTVAVDTGATLQRPEGVNAGVQKKVLFAYDTANVPTGVHTAVVSVSLGERAKSQNVTFNINPVPQPESTDSNVRSGGGGSGGGGRSPNTIVVHRNATTEPANETIKPPEPELPEDETVTPPAEPEGEIPPVTGFVIDPAPLAVGIIILLVLIALLVRWAMLQRATSPKQMPVKPVKKNGK